MRGRTSRKSERGELITEIEIPLLPRDATSGYLKVRDRASYEFALTPAAVALRIDKDTITHTRVGLGGVGTIPWSAREAEAILEGAPAAEDIFRAAARVQIVSSHGLQKHQSEPIRR